MVTVSFPDTFDDEVTMQICGESDGRLGRRWSPWMAAAHVVDKQVPRRVKHKHNPEQMSSTLKLLGLKIKQLAEEPSDFIQVVVDQCNHKVPHEQSTSIHEQ